VGATGLSGEADCSQDNLAGCLQDIYGNGGFGKQRPPATQVARLVPTSFREGLASNPFAF
jgi:hypothetical protein